MKITNNQIIVNILKKMSDDECYTVRETVAKHDETSKETLLKLSLDENIGVKLAVIRNDNITLEILKNLLKDEQHIVRCKAISRLNSLKEFRFRDDSDDFDYR